MLWLRANGALQLHVFCEDGSRASLEVKKRAAAPETMNSGTDMVLDSAAVERRQHCNQGDRTARPEGGREAISNSGGSATQLRPASDSAGQRAANTRAIDGARKRHCHDKNDALRSVPCSFGVGSGPRCQGNVDGPAWEQRMSIMRRFGEFTKKHRPEMLEGNVPLFIVSLKLAESSGVRHTRVLLLPMGAGKAPAQALLSGLRRAAGANPTRQAPPMMWRGPDLVCNAMCSERDCVATWLAWVTAGRWDKIALLQKKNFIEHPSDRNALIFDWGALPKTFKAGMRKAAIAGAAMVRKVVLKTEGCWGARCTWRVRGGGRTRFGTENSNAAGETRGPAGTATLRLGHWVAILNSSAKLTALIKRARGEWAKTRRQGRFLMGTGFWDVLELPERRPPRNSGDCRCRKRPCGRCCWNECGTSPRCGAMCFGRRNHIHQTPNRSLELMRQTPEKWRGPASFAKCRSNLPKVGFCPSPL
ncbi:hypothetical protein ERJ75_000340400 [Trypanosoma vivax]|nr:hypothetical protein ERJ75_000340400 [Trypanosoma vivax]